MSTTATNNDREWFGRWAHVYGQSAHHDDVFIVASASALRDMRDAINRALGSGIGATPDLYPNDGEGYQFVVVREDDEARFDAMAVPYTRDYAEEKRDAAIWPWRRDDAERIAAEMQRANDEALGLRISTD